MQKSSFHDAAQATITWYISIVCIHVLKLLLFGDGMPHLLYDNMDTKFLILFLVVKCSVNQMMLPVLWSESFVIHAKTCYR